jgi:glycosyltransferase involved in cell wall biosynthesis
MIGTMGNGCKLIYSDQMSRSSHPSRGFKSLFRFLRNRLLQKYIHTIIADAQFIRDCQIHDFYTKPDKISVVYNGVNLNRFAKADPAQKSESLKKLGVPVDTSVVVSIAQCIKDKGLDFFIQAAGIILEKRPNSIFFVIGDGPERSALERQAKALGLQDKVVFTGVRTDTEMYLSIADVFVLLSVWEEAFAFTLLEAMASSCPVVATRVGAIPESILDGVTGILVPPQDVKATAEAILELLNDGTLRKRMGLAGRERVERHFSLERWIEETIRIYENAISS